MEGKYTKLCNLYLGKYIENFLVIKIPSDSPLEITIRGNSINTL